MGNWLLYYSSSPSLNTKSCINGVLVVQDFCFWAVRAAGPVHKKSWAPILSNFWGQFSKCECTGTPPLTWFFGPGKNLVKGKPHYRSSILVLKPQNGEFEISKCSEPILCPRLCGTLSSSYSSLDLFCYDYQLTCFYLVRQSVYI